MKKIKLLVVSEIYPSEVNAFRGVYIKQQIEQLINLGYDVDILIPRRGIKFDVIKKEKDNLYSLCYKTSRYELLINMNMKSVKKSLKRFVHENNYDVVAVHIASDSIINTVIRCCLYSNIKVYVHFHGLNVWRDYTSSHVFREKYYANRRKRILNKANGLIGVSKKVVDIIKERIKKVPAYCVYNGVDNDAFKPLLNQKNNRNTIVAIGNLIPTKGFDYLLRAFSEIKERFNKLKLIIIGDGPEKGRLKNLSEQLNISKDVRFLGTLPYDEVPVFLSDAFVFALPSYYEALGCVYLEAMATGLPIIAVRGAGIDEIITDGKEGFLVKPKDISDIVFAICKMLDNYDLYLDMRKNAIETSKNYSWKNSAIALSEIYVAGMKK